MEQERADLQAAKVSLSLCGLLCNPKVVTIMYIASYNISIALVKDMHAWGTMLLLLFVG